MLIMTSLIYLFIHLFNFFFYLLSHLLGFLSLSKLPDPFQQSFGSYFQLKSSVSASLQESENANYLRKFCGDEEGELVPATVSVADQL